MKRLYNAVLCRCKIDYGCQLYSTASPGKIKKLDNIHREGIRIYTGAFRTLPVKSLYTEAGDPTMELKRNELGLRSLYRLKSNSIYTVSKYLGWQRGPQLYGKQKRNQTNKNTTKKTRIRVFKRAERGELELPDTTTHMANKQYTLLL